MPPKKTRKVEEDSQEDTPPRKQRKVEETTGEPNQTLYIKNLNDKIHQRDVNQALYMLFSTYGHVVGVATQKSAKMRGQAHVAFGDLGAAQQALHSLQHQTIFGKPMEIRFANSPSKIIARLSG